MCKIVFNKVNFALLLILSSFSVFATTDVTQQISKDLPREEIFPPQDGRILSLQGKISNERYSSPQGIFSCKVEDFNQGRYIAQDALLDQAACVGFYSASGDFKKAEILFIPILGKQILKNEALKAAFESFGIGILKSVDNAQGIEILTTEMLEDGLFFAAVSIQNMSVLELQNGYRPASSRGYLIFQEKDKPKLRITN